MKQLHLIISGIVQGVGFRAWVRREARNLGLTGWVRNREDETVEIVAIGEEPQLKRLSEVCKTGPEIAHVEAVRQRWSDTSETPSEFTIKH